MSKQSEAKKAQGYTETPKGCGSCASMTADLVLPKWMLDDNMEAVAKGFQPRYGDKQRVEKNLRCGIGGFAVKKTAVCRQFAPKLSQS